MLSAHGFDGFWRVSQFFSKNCVVLHESNSNKDFPLCSRSWNKSDKSHEVRLYGPKNRIAHFHPNWSNGTAGVRGTRVLNGGRYYWEINVSQRIFGTSMVRALTIDSVRLYFYS